MPKREHSIEDEQDLDQVLGYLNFSSGNADAKFLSSLNRIWRLELTRPASGPMWRSVLARLEARLSTLAAAGSPAFQDAGQATAVMHLLTNHVVSGYLKYHEDLLFHHQDAAFINALFLGRLCEAVLRQGGPWNESDRITRGAIQLLNDYVGYRPVAVLENRRLEPYPHERLRPVPLWIRGVGPAAGAYENVVAIALRLIEQADPGLLQEAHFQLDLLDELSLDPRAYDFDHPANKRPNYHFGQWDPDLIDQQGRYRRFVVQEVTLDALMRRLESETELPADELEFEAGSVLAGTILMASGVSGRGPGAYDSETTLTKLLPRIAAYRDAFYEQLITQTSGPHGKRLIAEAKERRQPFGGARQHLNGQLARRRASQLEHVQLAAIFAKLGYPEEAAQHAQVVPAASARILCQVDCRLTDVSHSIDDGDLPRALGLLNEVMELIRRGIGCGAIVDPWNILGFDAQFSLFPAAENSVHDHRVDELIERMERIFSQLSRLWSEAAAIDDRELSDRVSTEFRKIASWWRQFAAHEVSNVTAIDVSDALHAAEHVARALNLWHKGGAASGDIGFWASHAEMFDSPQAYALVIDALIHQEDTVASMGLLIHWLSQGERIPLAKGTSSFHELAQQWLRVVFGKASQAGERATMTTATWKTVRRFFDYLEANAGVFGVVPKFALGSHTPPPKRELEETAVASEPDEDQDLFGAAYENVVFKDSADDGIEGALFETGPTTNDELTRESERLVGRLAYFDTLASLWRIVALTPLHDAEPTAEHEKLEEDRFGTISRWVEQAQAARAALLDLLTSVQGYPIRAPAADHDSLVDYDRQRVLKESLLERVINTSVEVTDSARMLAAAILVDDYQRLPSSSSLEGDNLDEESLTVATFAAILRREPETARLCIEELLPVLATKPLLYVPIAKNGNPRDMVETRTRQRCIQSLLKCLPRIGLLVDTCRLLETAREMERNHPVGPGAVTEFDELFKIGYRSLVESLVVSFDAWKQAGLPAPSKEKEKERETELTAHLISQLEKITESMLVSWLAHSRTLRLSVLEKASDKRTWLKIVEFVERYGGELFSQRFLNLSNIRAILHQGVGNWLDWLNEAENEQQDLQLLCDLESQISRADAIERLTLILEAIVENYGEYRDYNSTTTQSDRGELLYTLLDFLRLRARYDRVCWNLKPVVLAHEILVRRSQKQAAQVWRRALRERIGEEADKFHQKLVDLQKKYAMQMPSIADRISERFLRPLSIDRLCALVKPAADEARKSGARPNYRMLKVEIESLTREPSGVGFDIPAWLVALEEEVERATDPQHHRTGFDDLDAALPYLPISPDDTQRMIEEWTDEES